MHVSSGKDTAMGDFHTPQGQKATILIKVKGVTVGEFEVGTKNTKERRRRETKKRQEK